LASTSACSQNCTVLPKYKNFGGSEYSTELSLKKDNTFILTHNTWAANEYNTNNLTSTNGSWSCFKKDITFKFEDITIKANFSKIGSNPWSIKQNTKVISFEDLPLQNLQYLKNEILYPSHSL